jgi:hypothetical protein
MKQTIPLRTTERISRFDVSLLFLQQADESQIDNKSVQDRNLATFADRQLGVSQLLFYCEL